MYYNYCNILVFIKVYIFTRVLKYNTQWMYKYTNQNKNQKKYGYFEQLFRSHCLYDITYSDYY